MRNTKKVAVINLATGKTRYVVERLANDPNWMRQTGHKAAPKVSEEDRPKPPSVPVKEPEWDGVNQGELTEEEPAEVEQPEPEAKEPEGEAEEQPTGKHLREEYEVKGKIPPGKMIKMDKATLSLIAEDLGLEVEPGAKRMEIYSVLKNYYYGG